MKEFLCIHPRQPGWCPMTPFDAKPVVQAEVDLKEEIGD